MIISGLIYILSGILGAIAMVLPASSGIPAFISESLNYFIPKIWYWDLILPIKEVMIVLGLIFYIEIIILIYRISDWSYRKIRG